MPQRVSISAATLPTPPMPTTATCAQVGGRLSGRGPSHISLARSLSGKGRAWGGEREKPCAVLALGRAPMRYCWPADLVKSWSLYFYSQTRGHILQINHLLLVSYTPYLLHNSRKGQHVGNWKSISANGSPSA
jgi:hypothetical protein